MEQAFPSFPFPLFPSFPLSPPLHISLDEKDEKLAKEQVKKMCEELLVNSVIEDYELIIEKE
ncbi:hypothetical protein AT879_09095 [Campylobacter jejuni]|nr:hypothetical protein [Campylobacter jejuni]